MYRLGSVLKIPQFDQVKPKEGQQICRKCGQVVEFAEDQWRKTCKCGLVITVPQTNVIKSVEKSKIECFLCMDKGVVEYEAQNGDQLNNYAALCQCAYGMARKENGFPSIDQVKNVNLSAIEKCNYYEYQKRKGIKNE